MQFANLQTEIVPLQGGVDMVTNPLMVKPGRCVFAANFEPDINGGYRRIPGIERFDGTVSPSSLQYAIIEGFIVGPLVVGDKVVGTDSGATAIIADILATDFFVLTDIRGTFIHDEALMVGGVVYAYIDTVPSLSNAGNNMDHALYKSKAANAVRSRIDKVPGSGPVRGVKFWNDTVYAFRNSEDGSACSMFKSSSNGWQQVDLGKILKFDAATAEINEGDVIIGATSLTPAKVRKAVLETGAWTLNGAGFLIVDILDDSLAFQDNEKIQTLGANKADVNGLAEPLTLLPGGKFEFDIVNFFGNVDRERMYFVDGVNKIHEFDGSTIVPIKTGVGSDNPKYIAGHKKQLIVAIESELIVSGIGNPYSYTALTGAAQIATGETITGIKPQVGDTQAGALVVGTKKKIYMLYGNDVSDYILVVHSPDSACVPYTIQNIGFAHFWDARGLTQLMASQAYGSFQSHILTQSVQPFVDKKAGKVTTSCVSRANNLYKIFFSDGDGLNIQIMPNSNYSQPVIGDVMPFSYGERVMNVTDSSIDSNGVERKFGGCVDGYVYELDVGTSFDGDKINSFLVLSFNPSKSPDNRKNYKRCKFILDSGSTANIATNYDLSFGGFDSPYSDTSITEVLGSGGYWDTDSWDDVFWDIEYSQEITIDTPGNGSSISLVLHNESDVDESFVIEICKLQFTVGRTIR